MPQYRIFKNKYGYYKVQMKLIFFWKDLYPGVASKDEQFVRGLMEARIESDREECNIPHSGEVDES